MPREHGALPGSQSPERHPSSRRDHRLSIVAGKATHRAVYVYRETALIIREIMPLIPGCDTFVLPAPIGFLADSTACATYTGVHS